MKKLFVITSFVAFIIAFTILSDSCVRKPRHESSEKFDEATVCYDEALDMYSNDSLHQAFPKFIEVLEMIETLPEYMSKDEKYLASRAYCNITRILFSRLEMNVKIDAARKAFYYQKISDDIDTLSFPLACLLLAGTFDSETESDSVIYYSKMAIPLIDTVGEDASLYILSQQHLSVAYRHQKKYDSCLLIKRNMIAFSDRRGLDTKADSLALGIDMFYSSYKIQSKPYLLKVLDIDASDVMLGMVMQLLEQIYEIEDNHDSVLFCRSYYKPSFEAEMERVKDVDCLVEIYNDYSTERDARLYLLREQKEERKRNAYIIASAVLFVTLISALILHSLRNKNKFNKRTEQLNSIIAANEFKYSMIDGKIRKMNAELRKKEKIIREKEGELNEIKNKIERIEKDSDIDAYYKSEICRKIINRRTTDISALSNEELALLLQTADKHLNNITARLKEKYHKLDKDDMYYICLILLNTEEYNMQYLLNRNRKTVWYRLNKIKTIMNLEKNSDILAFVLNNYIK